MDAFDMAWDFLKSYRMGRKSPYSTHHYPVELDYNMLRDHLQANENTTLGDLVKPYMEGAFTSPDTATAFNPPSHQGVAIDQRSQPVEARWPLSRNRSHRMMAPFVGEDGYAIPDTIRDAKGGGNVKSSIDPRYQQLGNAVKVLQMGLRGQPQIDFSPSRTSGGSQKRGVTSSSMADRMGMYLNTPVSLTTPVPDLATESMGVPMPTQEEIVL